LSQASKRRRWAWGALGSAGVLALALGAVCGLSGCGVLGYYGQSVAGHLQVMNRAQPVRDLLADEQTTPRLRERLALAQRMRQFAVQELALPDNASYTRYADLERSAVVWNVVAAPTLSLELKTWCFAVVGCVGYRGYYRRDDAQATAAALEAEGWEVRVYGVPAYSTLGWLNWAGGDPLLNTFLFWPEGELARLIFHELAHQAAFAADDMAFNESYATAVERLGAQRWLAQHASAAARAEYEALDARRRDFKALTQRTRDELAAVYASTEPEAAKRVAKAQVMQRMQEAYLALKASGGHWQGFQGYDAWFASANNAVLAVQAAYDDAVPAFERLFEAQGRDFARFHAEVKRLARLPKAQRAATLAAPAVAGHAASAATR
jgi:predicted aminopeptidase